MSLKESKTERARKTGDISRSIPEPQKPHSCEASPEQGGGDGGNSGHLLEGGTWSRVLVSWVLGRLPGMLQNKEVSSTTFTISITVPVRVSPSRVTQFRENRPQRSLSMVPLTSRGRWRGGNGHPGLKCPVGFPEEAAWELEGTQPMVQKQK